MSELEIYIEGQLIEQFKDEGVNIKSSVQNINDISKVFADFTKDFNVPASKANNKFFKHYYNADITGGFDARTKKSAELFLNKLPFKKGKIRLVSTSLKHNLIDSYKIQFEGDVIKVKDDLGDDKLNTLDLEAYNHTYNSANVKQGLQTSLFSGAIIYPTISPVRRFRYDSNDTVTNNELQTNIHYNPAKLNNAIDYTDLKPAIRVSKIFDLIQSKYGLSFTGDFFNRDYFTNLYLWLNKDEGYLKTVSLNASNLIDWDGGSNTWIDFATDELTINWGGYTSADQDLDSLILSNTITVGASYSDVEYSYVVTINDVEVFRKDNIQGTTLESYTVSRFLYPTGTVKFYIESNQAIEYSCSLQQNRRHYVVFPSNQINDTEVTTASSNLIQGLVDVSYQMPDVKTYDFLVGIIKMFNIALTANDDGSIHFETLPDWYRSGKVFKNFDKYIDVDSLEISRGNLNNEFNFNYEEPETLLAAQFRANNGVSYGDLEARLYDNDGVLLDGSKLEVKVPFENMIYERLTDEVDNSVVDFQYGFAVDKELNPIVTAPLLFYNVNKNITGIGFKNDDNSLDQLTATINIPNHCLSLTENDNQTLNFGAEISTYNYGLMNESLYNSFYKDYVTDMFSNQRRMYKFDAVIPAHILTEINLNDRLIIGNKRYIINSINSNLTTQKTKLELLNDIYTSGDIIGDSFYLSRQGLTASGEAGNYSFVVYSKGAISTVVDDLGDGIFTTLVSKDGESGVSSVFFDLDKNNTGSERYQSLTISQSGYSDLKFYITQKPLRITVDNNTITVDNNIITVDSN